MDTHAPVTLLCNEHQADDLASDESLPTSVSAAPEPYRKRPRLSPPDYVGQLQLLLKQRRTPAANTALAALKDRMQSVWIAARLPLYAVCVSPISHVPDVQTTYLFSSHAQLALFLKAFRKGLSGAFNALAIEVHVCKDMEEAEDYYDHTTYENLIHWDEVEFPIDHVRQTFVNSTKTRAAYIDTVCAAWVGEAETVASADAISTAINMANRNLEHAGSTY